MGVAKQIKLKAGTELVITCEGCPFVAKGKGNRCDFKVKIGNVNVILERWANEVLTLDTRVALAEIVRDHRISDRHLIPICRIVGSLADDGWSVEMICSALSSRYDYSKIRRMQND